ncbi:MAG: FIVAR domain-containing protein, partial [Propionibacteriaceae bacterium]|nr:FIVAR domain-containing protein [Propionibacteriaceae bacterium]
MLKARRLATALLSMAVVFSALPYVAAPAQAANPFLPLWERIPDGEPRVFTDPATGEQRVYVYGSHDTRLSGYCGPEHVVWSAPVNDLTNWRHEGEAFHVDQLNGARFKDSDGVWKQLVVDVAPIASFVDAGGAMHQGATSKNQRVQLYAPDVVYHPENNKYYMYLFVDGMWHVNANADRIAGVNDSPAAATYQRRHPMFVAESTSPAGPFTNPKFVTLAFDPAVLVDTDNKDANGKSRVFLYWTPEERRSSFAAELDPTDMATILPGTEHYPTIDTAQAPNNTMPSWNDDGGQDLYMFEGSSVRTVVDPVTNKKSYFMVYCRGADRTAYNQTSNISEIGYAYADTPFGPWTYGGVIVSNYGERIVDPYTGTPDTKTFSGGNIHGGTVQVNGQWYQVYHRDSNISGKRQAMAEPFTMTFNASGYPVIEQVEMTSQGFDLDGLDPFEAQNAGYASYILPTTGQMPQFFTQFVDATQNFDPAAERDGWYPVKNLRNHSWLGYKYFNFGTGIDPAKQVKLVLSLVETAGITGTINIYTSNAKTKQADPEQPKTKIGEIALTGEDTAVHTVEGYVQTSLLTGKQGIYLEFISADSGELAQVNTLQFVEFVPVTTITDVPLLATIGTPLTLSGTVDPVAATDQVITWSVADAAGTGAAIAGDQLTATASGTAVIRATIADGTNPGVVYTQDFNVVVTADASGLQTLVDDTQAAISAGDLAIADYTVVSWSALSSAITAANGVLATAPVTAQQVTQATNALNNAINALTPRGNTAGLVAALAAADAVSQKASIYTTASYQALSDAADAARAVQGQAHNSSQADVDAATQALNIALGSLVVDTSKETDAVAALKTVLGNQVTAAGKLTQADYEAASWAALQAAVAAAKATAANPNSTGAQVQASLDALTQALSSLKPIIKSVEVPVEKIVEKVVEVPGTTTKAGKVTTTSVKVSASAFKKASKPKITVSIKLSSGVAKGKIAVYV